MQRQTASQRALHHHKLAQNPFKHLNRSYGKLRQAERDISSMPVPREFGHYTSVRFYADAFAGQ